VAIGSDKDILWLEVTIDDTRGVQALDTLNDFGGIEAGTITAKAAPACQLCCKITARMEVHDQKQIFFIMKTPPEFDYEWICPLRCHATQYGLFCKRVLKFLVRKHMSLGDRLEGIQVRATFVADKEYFARTSFSKHAHHLKVRHLHFARDTLLGAP
jgi:hypothetical protein